MDDPGLLPPVTRPDPPVPYRDVGLIPPAGPARTWGLTARYPVGTTIAVPVDGRRVFATAYSRLGNDLVARSGYADLRFSLDSLWASVAVHGLFKPVAVPLIGSGLARVTELDHGQLVALIVDSFIGACRRYPALTPELRIVVRPEDLARTDLSAVEKRFHELELVPDQ